MPLRHPFLSESELNSMTLQVGLIGSDGAVLASDTKVLVREGTFPSPSTISKIFSSEVLTCCWAGDEVSQYAAQAVVRHDWSTLLTSGNRVSMISELCKLGRESWQEYLDERGEPPYQNRTVMIVFHADTSLWVLDVGRRSNAERYLDCRIAGDPENTARHFAKYASNCREIPVANLITLAAYTIIVAGEENPKGVGGLEVAVIPRNGPARILTASQEQELHQRASAISRRVREGILEPFKY